MSNLYPLKFTPILKDKIWGGNKLKKKFGKVTESDNLGESWELSGYAGEESIVLNGPLAGNTLAQLISKYKDTLIGKKILNTSGESFPLLFKLIDANDNLSIQVHPGDEVAKKRHNSFGKTEMWYVVDADKGAELIIGFTKDCTKEEYLEALSKGIVDNLLQKVDVKKGDVFFIPAGLVHAIGKGVVIAEIQQSSDITYRIYDYMRKDDNGNERELHTEEALDVINFKANSEPKTNYSIEPNKVNKLIRCQYFTTNIIQFNKTISRNYNQIDSFISYMCIEGSFMVEYNNNKLTVIKGETILIPACIDEIKLVPLEETTLLEVYIE